MSTSEPLFHLVAEDLWKAAKQQNVPYFPPTYEQDGFIHLTGDPSFLVKVGNMFYKDSPYTNWLLLVLDPTKITAKVVWEPAAPVGAKPSGFEGDEKTTGPLFPHLYGTIDYESVKEEVPVQRGTDGTFISIPGYC